MQLLETISAQTLCKAKESVIAKKETNDCTVYAFASAFGLDYDTAHKTVAEKFGRVSGRGVKSGKLLAGLQVGTTFQGKTVVEVIQNPTTEYKAYGKVVPRRVRLSSFITRHKQGTYLILIRNHALAVVNGVVVDNLSVSAMSSYVKAAFKIK